MLICFVCQKQHTDSQQLISHLRGEHSYYPGSKFKLICSQQGCRHQFQTYAGFRKHLNSVHSNVQLITQTSTVGCSSSEPVASSSQVDALEELMNPHHQSPCSSALSDNNDSGLTKNSTKELCESIVAKIQASGIPNSLVSSIVGDLEELTDELKSQAKQNVLSALPTNDPYKTVINESFEKLENPFTNLNTEWKRNKYYKEKWGCRACWDNIRCAVWQQIQSEIWYLWPSTSEWYFYICANFRNIEIHVQKSRHLWPPKERL